LDGERYVNEKSLRGESRQNMKEERTGPYRTIKDKRRTTQIGESLFETVLCNYLAQECTCTLRFRGF
jgi:hypothetical protein